MCATPSSSQARSGSMPWMPVTIVPSLHGPSGSLGGEDEHAAAHGVGDHDVEHAVAVPDGGCPGAAVGRYVGRRQLARPFDDVADQRPVDQVAAVEDRNAWQVLECRGGEVVVVADPQHARIRVEAGEQGVRVGRLGAHGGAHRTVTVADSGVADTELPACRVNAPGSYRQSPLSQCANALAGTEIEAVALCPDAAVTGAKPTSQRTGRSTELSGRDAYTCTTCLPARSPVFATSTSTSTLPPAIDGFVARTESRQLPARCSRVRDRTRRPAPRPP